MKIVKQPLEGDINLWEAFRIKMEQSIFDVENRFVSFLCRSKTLLIVWPHLTVSLFVDDFDSFDATSAKQNNLTAC